MSTHAMDDRQAIDHASAELTPIPLMQIITGVWAAKTLAAAVELDLFTTLAGTGTDTQELMQVLGLPARPTEMGAPTPPPAAARPPAAGRGAPGRSEEDDAEFVRQGEEEKPADVTESQRELERRLHHRDS
jgi:hypothetical protein